MRGDRGVGHSLPVALALDELPLPDAGLSALDRHRTAHLNHEEISRTANTPLWKLRRLAPRAKRVQARRAADAPAVAAYGPTLLAKADAFIAAYDSAARYETTWRKEMAEGKGAIAALVAAIRAWLP